MKDVEGWEVSLSFPCHEYERRELMCRSERAHTTQSDIRLLLLLFSRYFWRDVLHGIGTIGTLVHQAHIHTGGEDHPRQVNLNRQVLYERSRKD
jgi:hypothetical protein